MKPTARQLDTLIRRHRRAVAIGDRVAELWLGQRIVAAFR